MKTRDFIFPLIFIPLGITFFTIAILLWVKKGESRQLLAAKMRIGALLLSFSFFAACSSPPPVSCYKPAPPENTITIDTYDTIFAGDTIRGRIFSPSYPIVSYSIKKPANDIILQNGSFSAIDTAQAYSVTEYNLVIDSLLETGRYTIGFYGQSTHNEKPVFIYSEEFDVLKRK